MKILIVNKFLHHVGGVETYVDTQRELLDGAGAELSFFGMQPPDGEELMPGLEDRSTLSPNREFNSGRAEAARSALSSVYSFTVARMLQQHVEDFQPDVVHIHSTCRQLTPAVARVLHKNHLPAVMTAHEYKQVCASQRLWDDRTKEVCTECVSARLAHRSYSIASKSCVRGSLPASILAIAEVPLADHLWNKSRVILHAPSRFTKTILESAPYVESEVEYLDLPWGPETRRVPSSGWEDGVLYMGRLAPEKGIEDLLLAWLRIKQENLNAKLIIAGSGSSEGELREIVRKYNLTDVEFAGRYSTTTLPELLGRAAVTVHPSRWHENSPFTVRESLQYGVPAVVTDVGGLPEMVSSETGTVVRSRDVDQLADAVLCELRSRRADSAILRNAVRERACPPSDHLQGLMQMYARAQSRRVA